MTVPFMAQIDESGVEDKPVSDQREGSAPPLVSDPNRSRNCQPQPPIWPSVNR